MLAILSAGGRKHPSKPDRTGDAQHASVPGLRKSPQMAAYRTRFWVIKYSPVAPAAAVAQGSSTNKRVGEARALF